jgi:GNAT superfamily N-acetyltransferase
MSFIIPHTARLSLDGATLDPMDNGLADILARDVAAIDPWVTLGIADEALRAFLAASHTDCHKWVIRHRDKNAGLIVVRSPWLYGPYINLLAILPGHQGHGLGSAVLTWIEEQVQSSDANLWVCASTFNLRAIQFYTRRGFQAVGDLRDLVRVGFSERLFRKQIT